CSDEPATVETSTGGEGGAGGMVTDLATAYCDCMLTVCHDAYHAAYGPETQEVVARSTCLAEAASLPEAGMDVDSGHFIECLLHHCNEGSETPDSCAATIGEGACAE